MMYTNLPIYLASRSPRRKKLLLQLNLKFKSIELDFEEKFIDHQSPVRTVKKLSLEKLDKAKKIIHNGIIITADTIVVLNKEIIGKPKNEADAVRILKMLSGQTHTVYTGFSVFNSITGKLITNYEKTAVTFRELSLKEIREYVKTGSPMDKAGAYGIQDDFGAVFIEKINGCYYNVVGLPLTKLYLSLKEII